MPPRPPRRLPSEALFFHRKTSPRCRPPSPRAAAAPPPCSRLTPPNVAPFGHQNHRSTPSLGVIGVKWPLRFLRGYHSGHAKKLQELEGTSSLRNKVKWLTLDTKIAEQLNDLENCKKTFALALTGDTHSVVTDIKSILDDNKVAEKRSKILAWLRAASPDATTNFNAARQKHEPLTGQWLLENAAFRLWSRQDGPPLWLKGIPGAGKTVIRLVNLLHLADSSFTLLAQLSLTTFKSRLAKIHESPTTFSTSPMTRNGLLLAVFTHSLCSFASSPMFCMNLSFRSSTLPMGAHVWPKTLLMLLDACYETAPNLLS